mgnify:FL=1
MLTTEERRHRTQTGLHGTGNEQRSKHDLSKSSDLEISNIAIDLKTEIEKVREQIQNVE